MSVPINSGHQNGAQPTTQANEPGRAGGELPHRRRMHVLLVDPTRLTRECLANYLREWSPDLDVQVAEEISHGATDQTAKPDIVVLNVKATIADEAGIRQKTSDIAATFGTDVPALILSERDESPEDALTAVRLGMRGYFPADLGIGLLIAAIRLIVWGGVFLSPATISGQVTRTSASEPGTARPSKQSGPRGPG